MDTKYGVLGLILDADTFTTEESTAGFLIRAWDPPGEFTLGGIQINEEDRSYTILDSVGNPVGSVHGTNLKHYLSRLALEYCRREDNNRGRERTEVCVRNKQGRE